MPHCIIIIIINNIISYSFCYSKVKCSLLLHFYIIIAINNYCLLSIYNLETAVRLKLELQKSCNFGITVELPEDDELRH